MATQKSSSSTRPSLIRVYRDEKGRYIRPPAPETSNSAEIAALESKINSLNEGIRFQQGRVAALLAENYSLRDNFGELARQNTDIAARLALYEEGYKDREQAATDLLTCQARLAEHLGYHDAQVRTLEAKMRSLDNSLFIARNEVAAHKALLARSHQDRVVDFSDMLDYMGICVEEIVEWRENQWK